MPTLPHTYIKIINENICKSKDITSFFDKEWLKKEIYTEQDYHPIMIILFRLNLLNKLIDNLKILEHECPKFQSIITKLKKDRDSNNFFSHLSEVDIISYYYRKYDRKYLEYEPSVEGGKKLDLLLSRENGVKYYFEIFTLFEDIIQQKYSNIMNELILSLHRLNLPYSICYKIHEGFESSNISEFVQFIEKSLDMNKTNNRFKFFKDNILTAEFRYINSESVPGVVSGSSPSKFLNPDERIKNKIFDKLNEQIPGDSNNIIVINLSYGFPLPFIIPEALEEMENPENIMMIITYVDNDYENKKKIYPNPKYDEKLLNEIIQYIN